MQMHQVNVSVAKFNLSLLIKIRFNFGGSFMNYKIEYNKNRLGIVKIIHI